MLRRKWWKNPAFFVIIILLAAGLPLLTNVILVISPNLTYHLLMRYQWVLYLILMLAFVDRYASEDGKTDIGIQWVALLAAGILVFNYGVSDNIGYSNLENYLNGLVGDIGTSIVRPFVTDREVAVLNITGMSGIQVYSSYPQVKKSEISLPALQPGIYIVTYILTDGSRQNEKIVIT